MTEVDVVVPAHDEAANIEPVLRAIRASRYVRRLFVVADACTDATAAISRHYAVVLEGDWGDKGSAMAEGLHYVSTPLVAFCDADLLGLRPGHIDLLLTLPPLEGQLVGLTTSAFAGLPSISGQRRLPAAVARQAGLWGSGWKAETLLNVAVARAGLPWRQVQLRGVRNPSKLRQEPWGWAKMFARVADTAFLYGPELVTYMTHPEGRSLATPAAIC